MKEPWKKTCNGKVIITLNDEKTAPTEVEVPVDLNWTNRNEKKYSAPKAVILMGIVLILGLTVVTLFKIQNLVYSTSYINWRMQELESTVSDSNDDVKLIKYKMSLEERDDEIALAKAARAEPLISSIGKTKNIEQQIDGNDLRISESQNQNHKLSSNSLVSESSEMKNMKESEVQHFNKGSNSVTSNPTTSLTETKKKISESSDLNDGRDHPNPADPEEWIKPLVETFDIFGNQPIEDHFIQNVLMKLLMPENNFEVLEFNKMHENSNNAVPEGANQNQVILNPIIRNNKEKVHKPLPLPIDSLLMKSLLPPITNFKVFHFNEKPEQQQQSSVEEENPPKMTFQNMKIKPMLPPIEGIVKSLLPHNNMKIFQFNDKQEPQSPEEDIPKITIQSIKLKLLPLPPQDDFVSRREIPASPNMNNNFEIIRLNESPEPSQDVEAPKLAMPITNFNPFPIPIQDIVMKSILPSSKSIEIVPLNDKPEDQPMLHHHHAQDSEMDIHQAEKFNPLPIPIQNILMKTLLPPPNQNVDDHSSSESQDQSNQEVEVTKIPIRTVKVNPFPLPIPEALMKSMLPVNNYGEPLANISDSLEETEHQQSLQQQQQLPQQHPQPQRQPQPQPQPQPQLQQQSEVPRVMARSTKLNPVDMEKTVSTSIQFPTETAGQ